MCRDAAPIRARCRRGNDQRLTGPAKSSYSVHSRLIFDLPVSLVFNDPVA
jgi:hypothetical protein